MRDVSQRLSVDEEVHVQNQWQANDRREMSETAISILKLNGGQLTRVVDTLKDVFNPVELGVMLQRRLGRSMVQYLSGPTHYYHVYFLVQTAQNEGWLGDLLAASADEKPEDIALLTLLAELNGNANLESPMSGSGLIDLGRLEQVRRCVCHLQTKDQGFGTGILIGPDLILTNGHVLNDLMTKGGGIDHAYAVFDHLSIAGVALPGRREVRFDPGWTPLHRPWAQDEAMPEQVQPAADELDYAILRLADPVGNQAVGDLGQAVASAPPRGWIKLPDPNVPASPLLPLPGRLVIVVQHPQVAGQTYQQVAHGLVVKSPWSDLRFRYTVTTYGGSSGSPCFDAKFQLVALHHASDGAVPAKFNQAVPLEAILKHLQQRSADFTSQGSALPWTFSLPDATVPPGVTVPPEMEDSDGRIPSHPNIMDVVVLGELPRIFFVNRWRLRMHLKTLTTETSGYRLVSVRGEPRSGKRHSRHLIEHEAGGWGINCTYFDASSPEKLTDSCVFIAEQMGFGSEAVDNMEMTVCADEADPARMGRKFARWLARATANQAPKRWWLILDGLHPNKNPTPELRDHLVGGLIEEMRKNKHLTQVVLFIIGLAPPADGYLQMRTLDDEITSLNTDDLGRFFGTYAQKVGKQLRPDEKTDFVKMVVGDTQGNLSAQQMNSLQADLAKAIGGFSV